MMPVWQLARYGDTVVWLMMGKPGRWVEANNPLYISQIYGAVGRICIPADEVELLPEFAEQVRDLTWDDWLKSHAPQLIRECKVK